MTKAWTGYRTTKIRKALSAFTMAEILLSLTIIGVVAAITLPSLTGNINERTWNTQRKALYARFSQAIALMPSLNGYGTLTEDESGSITDTAAETFVTEGLLKVLKINNICDSEHLPDCGIPQKITPYNGSVTDFPTEWTKLSPAMQSTSWLGNSFSMIDAKAAAFETQNGESVAVFYNPNCQSDMGEGSGYLINSKVCANLIYDLNGNKGPNTLGKDIGWVTIFYPVDSVVVAPVPAPQAQSNSSVDWRTATELCRNYDEGYRLPNKEEAASLFVNRRLLPNLAAGSNLWTATRYSATAAYHMFLAGILGTLPLGDTNGNNAWCIKR